MAGIGEQLKANLGKWVHVNTADGRSTRLRPLAVDQEGCTCRVADHPDYDEAETYWWSFDEIIEVVS